MLWYIQTNKWWPFTGRTRRQHNNVKVVFTFTKQLSFIYPLWCNGRSLVFVTRALRFYLIAFSHHRLIFFDLEGTKRYEVNFPYILHRSSVNFVDNRNHLYVQLVTKSFSQNALFLKASFQIYTIKLFLHFH